jgi:hypothetical protein
MNRRSTVNRLPCDTPGVSQALHYVAAGSATLHYRYTNTQREPVELWLALPPELPTQREIRWSWQPALSHITTDHLGLNRIAYLRLDPGETLAGTVQAQLYQVVYNRSGSPSAATLDPAERAIYLRSSPQVVLSDDVAAEAQRIVGDAQTPLEQAYRLHRHLARHYRYQWPPAARGSEAMRRERRGDCGQYSLLYAAWCRSLGIPCRVLYGSFAYGHLQAHAWNEVFIEGIGWLPVDTSRYQSGAPLPWLAELELIMQGVQNFGSLPADRLAFSIEPDIVLEPPYRNREAPTTAFRMSVGGRDLAWGFESIDGAAPYLQPLYPRFEPSARPSGHDLLGVWRFSSGWRYYTFWLLLWLGFGIGLLGTIVQWFGVQIPDLIRSAGWLTGNLAFIRLTGLRLWKLLLVLLCAVEIVIYLWQVFS